MIDYTIQMRDEDFDVFNTNIPTVTGRGKLKNMAEGKKSFVAYCDWENIFDMLSNEEWLNG